MALNGSKVETNKYIDTKYSSGDSNKIKCKQYQEENNNNIDELCNHLSEMGCIVDAVKRPPNICIETCVYKESNEGDSPHINTGSTANEDLNNDEIIYSDEFDEESDSDNDETNFNKTAPIESSRGLEKDKTAMSGSKAHTSKSCTDYGSVSQCRRRNMSFSNPRLRDIERQNHILLTKILSARNTKKSSIPPRNQKAANLKHVPSAAILRKVQRQRIDHENLILLKKIKQAKSSACSIRR